MGVLFNFVHKELEGDVCGPSFDMFLGVIQSILNFDLCIIVSPGTTNNGRSELAA